MVVATVDASIGSLAITPNGAFAYGTGSGPGDATSVVSVIETASNTVVATTSIAAPDLSDVAITPDGAFAYVTEGILADVWVIETASNALVATIDVGGGPFAVAITPF